MPMTTDRPYFYEIRVAGHLSARWSAWLDGLTIRTGTGGETILSGEIVDQAALLGLLVRLNALNLPLIALRRVEQAWTDG